jgi:hypothetical protein
VSVDSQPGEREGWRLWLATLAPAVRLCSPLNLHVVWEPAESWEASCEAGWLANMAEAVGPAVVRPGVKASGIAAYYKHAAKAKHLSPAEGCTCGIYAASSPRAVLESVVGGVDYKRGAQLMRAWIDRPEIVLGRVRLSGKVLRGYRYESGFEYKAERAQLLELFFSRRWRLASVACRRFKSIYGVPTQVCEVSQFAAR